jgi:serine phosphatase RsbU (regulator of sigma subunit)
MIFSASVLGQQSRDAPALKGPTSHESFSVWTANADGAVAGGDWCAIVPLSPFTVALTVGDVAGHGLAAADGLATMHAAILSALTATQVPSDVLAMANTIAYGSGSAVMVTALVAIFDRRYRTLTFANAGHPPPLVLSGDIHAFLEHPPADLPLGIYARHDAANYVVALPSSALLVLYTDGITEHARDPVRGEVELLDAARRSLENPELDAARAIAGRMLHPVRGDDDASVMALRLLPA